MCFTQNETLKPLLVTQLPSHEDGHHHSVTAVSLVWTLPALGHSPLGREWPEEAGAVRGWFGEVF